MNRILKWTFAETIATRQMGILKGKFEVGPEFFDALPPEELDAWEGSLQIILPQR